MIDFTVSTPGSILVQGPAGSGKTSFCVELLEQYPKVTGAKLPIKKFTLFYSHWQEELYTRMLRALPKDCEVNCVEGFTKDNTNADEFQAPEGGIHVVVFDDLNIVFKNKDLAGFLFKMCTVMMRHQRIHAIVILHSLFSTQMPFLADLRKNVTEIVLMNGTSGATLQSLAKELMPERPGTLVTMAKDAFSHYGHLIISPRSKFPYRTNYFAEIPITYVPD